MNLENHANREWGISFKIALLSWLVTLVTLLIFLLVTVPAQRRTFEENLQSKARGVSASLQDVTASAAVTEDYSTVVDHCKQVLQGDESIDYLVITKNDGFSLVNESANAPGSASNVIVQPGPRWRQDTLDKYWRPVERHAHSGIGVVPVLNRRVFHYSQPFDYSGIEWGWIHVGLSLKSYDQDVSQVYRRTGWLAVLCIAFSLGVSLLYARRLVRPIQNLQAIVRRVARGDLSARAEIRSGDEVESLAGSFNTMAGTLLQRDRILESVRFAAQKFLTTGDWREAINDVLTKIGQAAEVSRSCVFENHPGLDGNLLASQRYEYAVPGQSPLADTSQLQIFSWQGNGLETWAAALQRGEIFSGLTDELSPAEQAVLAPRKIQSFILVPIMVEQVWWGFLGLDDCRHARLWTDAERDSLRTIAEMLGAAIGKQRTQDKLLQAKEAAEAANHAKSQFLANMSHEIRTPITGVIGMLQLLRRTEVNRQQERYVDNALSAAGSLLTVIGDVLDFSKIEAGRLELVESRFNLAEVVDSAVRMFAENAERKGVEIACVLDENVPAELAGDPARLRQILINLVGNALKFTDQGSIAINCRLQHRELEKVRLHFEVRDTGCGIAAEHQAMIFGAFSQADNSMTRVHGGTGLGLSICRQLCGLMGGAIGVVSQLGAGCTFWFEIQLKAPVTNGHAGRTPAPAPQKIQPAPARPASKIAASILLAEDNEINQDAAREIIVSLGCRVTCVRNGQEALAAVKKDLFDLVLMDCQMPEMDGYEATRQIRLWEREFFGAAGRLPIVALTAHAATGERERCLAAGMDDYLTKPVDLDVLEKTVNTWLGRKANGAPSPLPPPKAGPVKIESSVPPLDFATLTYRCLGKPELVERLVKKFIQQSELDIQRLEHAVEQGDLATVAALAHRLKGASANLSAEPLRQTAAQLETAGRTGVLPDAGRLVPQLQTQFQILKTSCHQRVPGKMAVEVEVL